jgi:hypothetical protein
MILLDANGSNTTDSFLNDWSFNRSGKLSKILMALHLCYRFPRRRSWGSCLVYYWPVPTTQAWGMTSSVPTTPAKYVIYRTYQILKLTSNWTYQIANLSDTELIRYRTYRIPSLSDTELIRYRTDQTLNLSDTEFIRYRTYQIPTQQIPNFSDT